MAIDAPNRPHSPTGLSDLSSLTATSVLDREAERYREWLTVEQGILEQNAAPVDTEHAPVDEQARSLGLDLLERASQHPSEGQGQQGDEAASASARAVTPRLDRTWSFKVEDRKGTQGLAAGPSRITIAPSDPQSMAVDHPSTPDQKPVGMAGGEEDEPEVLSKIEESPMLQVGYGPEGSLVITGDRSSAEFQNILNAIRRAQGRESDFLLFTNPDIIPAPGPAPRDAIDVPRRGVKNGDGFDAAVALAAPMCGVGRLSVPRNVPAEQANPTHGGTQRTEHRHNSRRPAARTRNEDTIVLRPARQIPAEERVQRWIEQHRDITPQPIIEYGNESYYEGVASNDFEHAQARNNANGEDFRGGHRQGGPGRPFEFWCWL